MILLVLQQLERIRTVAGTGGRGSLVFGHDKDIVAGSGGGHLFCHSLDHPHVAGALGRRYRVVLPLGLQRVEKGRIPEAQRVPNWLIPQVRVQILAVRLTTGNVN